MVVTWLAVDTMRLARTRALPVALSTQRRKEEKGKKEKGNGERNHRVYPQASLNPAHLLPTTATCLWNRASRR